MSLHHLTTCTTCRKPLGPSVPFLLSTIYRNLMSRKGKRLGEAVQVVRWCSHIRRSTRPRPREG